MNIVNCTLRIKEELWEELKIIAEENSRSINKEIEFIIKKHIDEYNTKKETDK